MMQISAGAGFYKHSGRITPVGLLLGIVFSALLESMEDRVTNSRDLEQAGTLEYLGTITLGDESFAVSSPKGKG